MSCQQSSNPLNGTWLSSSDSQDSFNLEMDSQQMERQLQNKQAEISDLSNMLERAEDSFESILLEMLQKTEEALPKVICESVLLSLFSKRSVLKETGINRFTKRRIIKEKIKNLKSLISVLKLLQNGKDLKYNNFLAKLYSISPNKLQLQDICKEYFLNYLIHYY